VRGEKEDYVVRKRWPRNAKCEVQNERCKYGLCSSILQFALCV
jgi:hypothetical protein